MSAVTDSSAYALSNFVIGSAAAAPMADDERVVPVDPEVAPVYARLRSELVVDPEETVAAGSLRCTRG